MRIASLQPSVAITLQHLDALECLCAVTKYCVAAVPELTGRNLPLIQDAWTFADADQMILRSANADLAIASVPYRNESLAAILKMGISVLALAPRTLAQISQDILLIARQVDALPRANSLILQLEKALQETRIATVSGSTQTVYCEEWGKPLIHSQPWVSEMISAANGTFVGQAGVQTTAETIAQQNPDVLLFAWCGAGDRVPLRRIIEQRGWQQLKAVRAGRVFCIPDEYVNTPSFNLHDGLLAIRSALHPGLFPLHPRLKQLQA